MSWVIPGSGLINFIPKISRCRKVYGEKANKAWEGTVTKWPVGKTKARDQYKNNDIMSWRKTESLKCREKSTNTNGVEWEIGGKSERRSSERNCRWEKKTERGSLSKRAYFSQFSEFAALYGQTVDRDLVEKCSSGSTQLQSASCTKRAEDFGAGCMCVRETDWTHTARQWGQLAVCEMCYGVTGLMAGISRGA